MFAAILLAATSLLHMPDSTMLRILTYNIHHGEGTDAVVDLDRIAAVILAQKPDVVCLQEVDRNLPRTNHLDLPALLAEKLGMEVRFASNYNFEGGEYGNATLTALPIRAHDNHPLPRHEDREPRGMLRVTVAWQGREVDILNTHLGLLPEERLKQAEYLLRLLGDRPTLLCGDLNETPSGEALGQLQAVLRDAKPTPPGPEATVPSSGPRRRIDYVLHSAHWEARAAKIVDTPPAPTASDHLPVIAELEWVVPAGER